MDGITRRLRTFRPLTGPFISERRYNDMTSDIDIDRTHKPDDRAEAPLYRSWARRLVHVSGMPWRIVAALAGVSPPPCTGFYSAATVDPWNGSASMMLAP